MIIEPIHELPADELQLILDNEQKFFEWGLKPESNAILNDLAEAIKKSLVSLFPDYDDLILEIVDSNEAMYARSWATGLHPLAEGIEALSELYGVLHFQETRDEFREKEMRAAIKAYSGTANAPLVNAGRRNKKQVSAPREKKNKALLKYCSELMQAKPSTSAASLSRRIPKKEKAATVDGFTIYRADIDGDGEEKIYCIKPTGKLDRTVGTRAFFDYYTATIRKLER